MKLTNTKAKEELTEKMSESFKSIGVAEGSDTDTHGSSTLKEEDETLRRLKKVEWKMKMKWLD